MSKDDISEVAKVIAEGVKANENEERPEFTLEDITAGWRELAGSRYEIAAKVINDVNAQEVRIKDLETLLQNTLATLEETRAQTNHNTNRSVKNQRMLLSGANAMIAGLA